MRRSHALLAFIAVAFLVLSTGWAFAADGKGKPDPFLSLQQQIDDSEGRSEGEAGGGGKL